MRGRVSFRRARSRSRSCCCRCCHGRRRRVDGAAEGRAQARRSALQSPGHRRDAPAHAHRQRALRRRQRLVRVGADAAARERSLATYARCRGARDEAAVRAGDGLSGSVHDRDGGPRIAARVLRRIHGSASVQSQRSIVHFVVHRHAQRSRREHGHRRNRRCAGVAGDSQSATLVIFLAVVQPIVIDPIFNKYEPLKDEVLRQKLLTLASRAGIEGSRVYQVDMSKQTKTMNAYVNGIGPTNRIVMWDTLLAKLTHDEVLAVMGHEMGHYVMKHIWKTLALLLTLSVVAFYVVYRSYDPALRRWGSRWGAVERGDPASVPWLLLVAGTVAFFLSPVISGYSRMNEHNADVFGLELTHLNEPMATSFVMMAEDSKRVPAPHPLMWFWAYTYPPIAERIPFALHFRP